MRTVLTISLENANWIKIARASFQHKASDQHVVADEAENAKKMLKLMLASHDFADLDLGKPPVSEATKDKVRLALVNATAGTLRLVWDGKATYDSIFELSKGEIFDLAKVSYDTVVQYMRKKMNDEYAAARFFRARVGHMI